MNQHPQVWSVWHKEEHGNFLENNQVITNFWPREPNTWKSHGPVVADNTSLDMFPPRAAGLEFEGWCHAPLIPPAGDTGCSSFCSVLTWAFSGVTQLSLNHTSTGCDCQDSSPRAFHQAIFLLRVISSFMKFQLRSSPEIFLHQSHMTIHRSKWLTWVE